MQKDRDQRYQSAQELLDALQTFKRGTRIPRQAARLESRSESPSSRPGSAAACSPRSSRFWLPSFWEAATYSGNDPPIAPASTPLHRLAILPFRNLRQDAATDFLGFSLADAVITKLGYISSIAVRPSSSVDQYRNQSVDPRKVGADLNVDTLLTGSFIKDGDDLRINTQLIDVKQMRMIWQDTIDIKYEKLLTVEDRVAQQIISGLELNLSATEAGNLKLDNPSQSRRL